MDEMLWQNVMDAFEHDGDELVALLDERLPGLADPEDAYLERAEAEYWATHKICWDDEDRPFVAAQEAADA